MKTVEVNGREYKVIKKYKHFTLCEDKCGFKTCFDDFDLGLIPKFDLRYFKNADDERDNNRHIFEQMMS